MKPATVVRNEDRRVEAELTDDGVVPPQLYVKPMDEGEFGDVIEAVAQALGKEPNAVIEPVLKTAPEATFGDLYFIFNPQEMPVMDDEGDLVGWLPPYRAEEQIREALAFTLPAGWAYETQRPGVLSIFRD